MAKQQRQFLTGLSRLVKTQRQQQLQSEGVEVGEAEQAVVIHLMANSRHEVTVFAHC